MNVQITTVTTWTLINAFNAHSCKLSVDAENAALITSLLLRDVFDAKIKWSSSLF